ncbi:hypothetical protein PLICRDRAFT_46370 [Plicaturopsis crispa FD-325 SS-3]|uniref:Pali-domain-containing protein n=1 Tax=Plicaturopsis crispa FD-325 SS-3 TaxID=944288 RepID=A0A0C9T3W5_PLICR|nr:hypothetical protein PLICRDRAFT_46370 [Plicaturopsis crispa FD-325 SS-3]
MARIFCIPGIIFLLSAFVLNFLTSISLPYLTSFDIVRTSFGNAASSSGGDTNSTTGAITELRLGIWSYCSDDEHGDRTCSSKHHGYNVAVHDADNDSSVIIGASWTRGLAVHPVAAAVTFIALLLSFSTHVTFTLLSSLTAFLAALLTLIAFAIDIALLAYTKHQFKKLNNVDENTYTGPGFWLTFASFLLLLLAGCTVCFGRRRDRMSGATSYPMTTTKRPGFFSRFRKN